MSKLKVYTISGKAQNGKDTFATALKKALEKRHQKVLIIHLADYLKFLAKALYGWDGNKDEKGRTLLQNLGKNMRAIKEDMLIEQLDNMLKIIKNDYDYVLIPDVRFPNEIDFFENKYNAKSIHIKRKLFPGIETLTKEQQNDITETALDGASFDRHFYFMGDNLAEVDDAVEQNLSYFYKDIGSTEYLPLLFKFGNMDYNDALKLIDYCMKARILYEYDGCIYMFKINNCEHYIYKITIQNFAKNIQLDTGLQKTLLDELIILSLN